MESLKQLFVKRVDLARNFYLPDKRDEDAGYDLRASFPDFFKESGRTINPGQRALIPTNLILSIPRGYYGRIAPRSGLAFKSGVDTLAGVIDSGYRAEVGVILLNTDKHDSFTVREGDRIAQLIIESCLTCDLIEVNELPSSERGEDGYGSTGMK